MRKIAEALEQSRLAQVHALDMKLRAENLIVLAKLEPAVEGSEQASFIADHSELDSSDLEFLSREYRGTTEVAAYLEMNISTLKRRLAAGAIENYRDGKGAKRFVLTRSAVEYRLNQIKKEEEG